MKKIFIEKILTVFRREIVLSGMDDILDPNEQIIWSGKPDKKKFLLSSFWGIPFAAFFLGLTAISLISGTPFFFSPAIFTIPASIGLIIVPPLWQLRKVPHTEYTSTNQRLIIKSGITKDYVWFADLDDIKEVFVKIGFLDNLHGNWSLSSKIPKTRLKETQNNTLYIVNSFTHNSPSTNLELK